jgi:hypothetical protein
MKRSGSSVALLAIVATMGALGVVVMATSNRVDHLRLRQMRRATARVAEGMAESAIAECLDAFIDVAESQVPHARMVEHLKGRNVGGLVPGPDVFKQKVTLYRAERTEKLLKEDGNGLSVGQVEVAPLYYSLIQNHGEVEVTAIAEAPASKVYRRVTQRHYIVVDFDGTCRVNALPIRSGVFRDAREGDE